MPTSKWTVERFQGRIQDHLRWVAASPPSPRSKPSLLSPFDLRLFAKSLLRKSALAVPFFGPTLLIYLRSVKARLRFLKK